MDFQKWKIENDTIFFPGSGQVHDLRFTSENPEGIMVNFRKKKFNDFLLQKDFINSLPIFGKRGKWITAKVNRNLFFF